MIGRLILTRYRSPTDTHHREYPPNGQAMSDDMSLPRLYLRSVASGHVDPLVAIQLDLPMAERSL